MGDRAAATEALDTLLALSEDINDREIPELRASRALAGALPERERSTWLWRRRSGRSRWGGQPDRGHGPPGEGAGC
jgi:hypothetical protein